MEGSQNLMEIKDDDYIYIYISIILSSMTCRTFQHFAVLPQLRNRNFGNTCIPIHYCFLCFVVRIHLSEVSRRN